MSLTLSPAYFDEQTLAKMMEGVGRASGIPGSVAEFSTLERNGQSAVLLAQLIAYWEQGTAGFAGTPKSLHVFSSFAGLPAIDNEIDAACPMVRSGQWIAGKPACPTPAELNVRCASALPLNRVRMVQTPLSEVAQVLPKNARYALVHLQCGLYASTKAVLKALLENGALSEGALVLISDWNANRASPRFGARRAWGECMAEDGLEVSDAGSYGLLGHAFIVHSYRGMLDVA